jgi:hypothetical protein
MGKVIYMPVVIHPKKTYSGPTPVIDFREYKGRKLLEAVLRKHREDK